MAIIQLLCIAVCFLVNSCKVKSSASGEMKTLQPTSAKDLNYPPGKLERLYALPGGLKECSGIAELGHNKFVAANDNGNTPNLYVFSINSKEKPRSVLVKGVENNDWEELAADKDHIYISDTGNNGGKRQNLMIYKIKKNDLLSQDEVNAEIIRFSYREQTKFKDSNQHNFDCEALICVDDSIYLFTKNRGDLKTNLYGFPNKPGQYEVSILDSFDAEGLVTGADYRKQGQLGELALIGYKTNGKSSYPFVIYFPKVTNNGFFKGEHHRWDFEDVLQTETITFQNGHDVWITNEEEEHADGFIYKLSLK